MFEVGKCYTIPDDVAEREGCNKGMTLEVFEILRARKEGNWRLRCNLTYKDGTVKNNENLNMTPSFWKEINVSNRSKLQRDLMREAGINV